VREIILLASLYRGIIGWRKKKKPYKNSLNESKEIKKRERK
jgi:hypothetical protein